MIWYEASVQSVESAGFFLYYVVAIFQLGSVTIYLLDMEHSPVQVHLCNFIKIYREL